MGLSSTYRLKNSLGLLSRAHRKRYREVLSVITKYGLNELFALPQVKRTPLLRSLKITDPQIASLSRSARIRLVIEELDGAYIKVGQILSNRPDLLPKNLLKELEKLQDSVPPFSSKEVIKIIETELGQPLRDMFLMFNENPLASASIAQVHRAILLDTTPVVIKVRRPQLEEKFRIDLDILTYFSQHLAKMSYFKAQFKDKNPVKELRYEIEKELDFINETASIELFAKNFKDDPRIYVPKVYPVFSSKKVLTMEFVQGVKVTNTKMLEKQGMDKVIIADNLIDVGLAQIFDYRFFHGDPHPGNIVILPNQQICFLDFGLMGRISSSQLQTITDIIIAFAQNDAKKITRIISKTVSRERQINEDEVEGEVSELLDLYFERNLEDINVGEVLKNVLGLIYKYELTLLPNIYLLIKAVASYEGIGLKLNPKLEIALHAQKAARQILKQRLSPDKILKDLYSSSTETIALIKDFPGEIRNLLNLLQSGRLRMNIGIIDIREYIDYTFNQIHKSVNRLAFSIVLAAMILGSAMLLGGYKQAEVAGIPIFAGIGFIISFMLGLALLISILRSKGL